MRQAGDQTAQVARDVARGVVRRGLEKVEEIGVRLIGAPPLVHGDDETGSDDAGGIDEPSDREEGAPVGELGPRAPDRPPRK